MTGAEIKKLKADQCSKCVYYGGMSKNQKETTCDYLLITGHSRGCSPLECKEKGAFLQGNRTQRRTRPLGLY